MNPYRSLSIREELHGPRWRATWFNKAFVKYLYKFICNKELKKLNYAINRWMFKSIKTDEKIREVLVIFDKNFQLKINYPLASVPAPRYIIRWPQ